MSNDYYCYNRPLEAVRLCDPMAPFIFCYCSNCVCSATVLGARLQTTTSTPPSAPLDRLRRIVEQSTERSNYASSTTLVFDPGDSLPQLTGPPGPLDYWMMVQSGLIVVLTASAVIGHHFHYYFFKSGANKKM